MSSKPSRPSANTNVAEMRPAVDEAAIDGLKFSECLPIDLATEMLERRLQEGE